MPAVPPKTAIIANCRLAGLSTGIKLPFRLPVRLEYRILRGSKRTKLIDVIVGALASFLRLLFWVAMVVFDLKRIINRLDSS